MSSVFDDLIRQYKEAVKDKKLTLSELLRLCYGAISICVKLTEEANPNDTGADKKAKVLAFIESFYDQVVAVVDIAEVPNFIEPLVDKALKQLVVYLASSFIDTIVQIFNRTGWNPDAMRVPGENRVNPFSV